MLAVIILMCLSLLVSSLLVTGWVGGEVGGIKLSKKWSPPLKSLIGKAEGRVFFKNMICR